jgi:hypothetical protein
MPVECVRLRLKPGSLPRVREWAAELTRRRDEVMATLRDETVRVESAFLESGPDGDFIVYYMRVDDLETSRRAVESSPHPIDAYHRAVMREIVESRRALTPLFDFERMAE